VSKDETSQDKIMPQNNAPIVNKTLSWYLESYDDEPDRYDWGSSDEPKGHKLL